MLKRKVVLDKKYRAYFPKVALSVRLMLVGAKASINSISGAFVTNPYKVPNHSLSGKITPMREPKEDVSELVGFIDKQLEKRQLYKQRLSVLKTIRPK